MKINNPKYLGSGLMFMGFGIAAVAIGTNYTMGSAVRMGPAYFPIMLGGLLTLLGFIIAIKAFIGPSAGEAVTLQVPFGLLDMAIAVLVFVAGGGIGKLLGSAEYGLLAASILLSVLSFRFRPGTRPLLLLITACLVFAYLLKPLGLVLATTALVFVAALGGHEFRLKEVLILAVVLVIFSVLVFVKGLTLPFPLWPEFLG